MSIGCPAIGIFAMYAWLDAAEADVRGRSGLAKSIGPSRSPWYSAANKLASQAVRLFSWAWDVGYLVAEGADEW